MQFEIVACKIYFHVSKKVVDFLQSYDFLNCIFLFHASRQTDNINSNGFKSCLKDHFSLFCLHFNKEIIKMKDTTSQKCNGL